MFVIDMYEYVLVGLYLKQRVKVAKSRIIILNMCGFINMYEYVVINIYVTTGN